MLEPLELKVPPLAVTVAAAVLIAAAHRVAPAESDAATRVAGLVVGSAGAAFAVAGVAAFRHLGTTVDPRHPARTTRLATTGVYRWTRNPMYFGFVVMLAGLAVALWSVPGVACAGFTALYLHRLQILPEERWLRRRFGASFDAYAGQVPRWLLFRDARR